MFKLADVVPKRLILNEFSLAAIFLEAIKKFALKILNVINFYSIFYHQRTDITDCIAGYALFRVIHRIQSNFYFLQTLTGIWIS